jgi:hypothetical protein
LSDNKTTPHVLANNGFSCDETIHEHKLRQSDTGIRRFSAKETAQNKHELKKHNRIQRWMQVKTIRNFPTKSPARNFVQSVCPVLLHFSILFCHGGAHPNCERKKSQRLLSGC